MHAQVDRPTDRPTDRQTDRQTDLFKHQWHCICALQYCSKREHPEEFELCIRRVCACILKHTGKMKVWVFVTTGDICMNIQLTVSYPLGPECTEQWKIFSQVLWSIQVCIYMYPCWITSWSANLVYHNYFLQKTAWEKWQIRKKRMQHHQWWAIFW